MSECFKGFFWITLFQCYDYFFYSAMYYNRGRVASGAMKLAMVEDPLRSNSLVEHILAAFAIPQGIFSGLFCFS